MVGNSLMMVLDMNSACSKAASQISSVISDGNKCPAIAASIFPTRSFLRLNSISFLWSSSVSSMAAIFLWVGTPVAVSATNERLWRRQPGNNPTLKGVARGQSK